MVLDFSIPNAAWSGGHLILADDVAVSKVRRKRMSASVASKTTQCPASMAISRLIPSPPDPFGNRELGTSAHAVLEAFYQLPPAGRTIAALDVEVRTAANVEWATTKLERQSPELLRANADNHAEWLKIISQYTRGIFTVESPADIDCAHTEWELKLNIAQGISGDPLGVPSVFYIDRVDRKPSGELEVKDYKFATDPKKLRKPNPRYGDDYGDQQRLYTLAIEAETGERPTSATLLYPVLGGTRKIDVSEDALRTTAIAYRAAWDLMNASADRQLFEARPSALCGWCPAANSCPVANVTTEKASTAAAKQPSAIQLGIPVIRAGARAQDVLVAPGEQHPRQPIAPVEGDLFPVTAETAAGAVDAPLNEVPTPAEEPAYAPRMWEGEQAGAAAAASTEGHTAAMSENIQVRPEAPAYEETVGAALNLNSFAAIAVAGITAMSFEHLIGNSQTASRESISRLNNILAGIILRAQHQVTGQHRFQSGAQTRLRGLLHTSLEHRPAPFGGSAADWQSWIERTERFLVIGLNEAISLWERSPIANDDYLYFAVEPANAPTPAYS
ncbi:RecB family exonuclease [Microbacterium ginsengisoli]|nr:PD-(D/E)XK nuclease family protein [Microbacteriaceae bacterium K1510]